MASAMRRSRSVLTEAALRVADLDEDEISSAVSTPSESFAATHFSHPATSDDGMEAGEIPQVDGSEDTPPYKRHKQEKHGHREDRKHKQAGHGRGDGAVPPNAKVPGWKPTSKKVRPVYEAMSIRDEDFAGFVKQIVDACRQDIVMRDERPDEEFNPKETLKVFMTTVLQFRLQI